jgi:hypothetical protein
LTVSSSRAISARAAASSASCAPLAPARMPGRDCANALSAPSRPTRRMRMIVVGSTFHCSAAWRWVSSPVNSCCQI